MNTFNDASSNALFERIIENHNATTIILDESEVYDDDYHVDDNIDNIQASLSFGMPVKSTKLSSIE